MLLELVDGSRVELLRILEIVADVLRPVLNTTSLRIVVVDEPLPVEVDLLEMVLGRTCEVEVVATGFCDVESLLI